MIDFSTVPREPGCYLFKDKSNKIIYIGKAKLLRNRIKSYFMSKELDPKTGALVTNIASVDFIVTNSEVEALILEHNLIKKHTPKYNIDWKDAKRYAYIQETKEDFPRLLVARKKQGDGRFFGPFVSAAVRDIVCELLQRTFQIRTCKRLPKRACLRFHIGVCQAPCIGNISKTKYSENIKKAELVLKGKAGELIRKLKKEMKGSSDRLDYEYALELRNQIQSLEWLAEKQTMERQKKFDEDILNYTVKDGRVYLILFNVYKGTLENKQQYEFDFNENFLEEFIVQFYSENPVPKELVLPDKMDKSMELYLGLRRKSKVRVNVPQKGEKKKLLELVNKNIEATYFGHMEKLEDLKNKLKLHEIPTVIECFDISHISGTSTAASMVQFRNGVPDKSNYRRFKIRTVEGADDTASIAEVVRRRYTRLLKEKSVFPNLIIIDGGLGQLNSALGVLKELGIKIPIISIAKRFEEVYLPGMGEPLRFDRKATALKFLQEVRDEAHRFAISYHRVLRKKGLREK
jgi:excinuclease ABC subunit C